MIITPVYIGMTWFGPCPNSRSASFWFRLASFFAALARLRNNLASWPRSCHLLLSSALLSASTLCLHLKVASARASRLVLPCKSFNSDLTYSSRRAFSLRWRSCQRLCFFAREWGLETSFTRLTSTGSAGLNEDDVGDER